MATVQESGYSASAGDNGQLGAVGSGLVAVAMWGLAPVATRALVTQLAPLPLLVLRLSLASLALLPWCRSVAGRVAGRGAGRGVDWRAAGRLAGAGLLGMVGYNLPVTVGLQWLPASTAGLLLATEPVWMLVIAFVALSQRPGRRAWAGSAVAVCGVLVLAGPRALAPGAGLRGLAGMGLVLAGTMAFGGYTIALRPLSRDYGALPATAATTVAGSLPYLALAGLVPWHQLASLPPMAWTELIFLGLGSTVTGMLLWNRAILSAGSARISPLLYLEPLVSVVSAVLLLGERVPAATVAGGLLVMAGVVVAGALGTGGAASVPGHLVDAVDHPGEVAEQLQQQSPDHLHARAIVNQHRDEREKEAQNDQEYLAHRCPLEKSCPIIFPLTRSETR
jgi:drug/metabolite transporter (DMT)-like permease